ncbi:MAG TPA: hypothetical protein QGH56_04935 [Candidatus Marinimicrobia bacterium]|jgi:hypothetical protein|nr:hypothetical protein [Candidatus Neomarinimicrobiota bacterium]|tara:strand:+ start:397 stop:564 length:168 start_codon:yes stop_codon:yes gene_type:complete
MKYKNKDGIELTYEGHYNDTHVELIKEVIRESIRLIEVGISRKEVIKFLEENFSL